MNLRSGALFAVWLLGLATAEATAKPVISFSPQAVAASGLTPGGKVVWFGVAREISQRTATLVRREEIVTDDDKDGAVRLELGRLSGKLTYFFDIQTAGKKGVDVVSINASDGTVVSVKHKSEWAMRRDAQVKRRNAARQQN